MIDLSILICTLENREESFLRLLSSLSDQVKNIEQVEILSEVDTGLISTGEKRNKLLNRATGKYLCFIDDDDEVSEDYVEKILKAIRSEPDCVGIKLNYFENGIFRGIAHHSIQFSAWRTIHLGGFIRSYQRTPNHLNPIKTEFAKLVKYKHISHGEDFVWSGEVNQYLKSECEIAEPIYNYKYVEK